MSFEKVCAALLLAVFGILALAGPALAHGTKDRVKMPLNFSQPGVDDVAYFVESYVHRELYSDGTSATENRFVVKDFAAVEQNGVTAVVRFVTLDKNGNKSFEDSMTLNRGADGVWRYQPKGGGEPLEVFTFVTKTRYHWETSWKRIVLILGALACLSPAALWYVKREERKARARATDMAQASGDA